jgi:hypothetical protein
MELSLTEAEVHEIRVALSVASLSLEQYGAQEKTTQYDSRIALIDQLIEKLPITKGN